MPNIINIIGNDFEINGDEICFCIYEGHLVKI